MNDIKKMINEIEMDIENEKKYKKNQKMMRSQLLTEKLI